MPSLPAAMSSNVCQLCRMPYYEGACLKCGRAKPLLPWWRWHDTAMVAAILVGLVILAYYLLAA